MFYHISLITSVFSYFLSPYLPLLSPKNKKKHVLLKYLTHFYSFLIFLIVISAHIINIYFRYEESFNLI